MIWGEISNDVEKNGVISYELFELKTSVVMVVISLFSRITVNCRRKGKNHSIAPYKQRILNYLNVCRNFVKDLEANEKDEMSKFALHTLNSLDPTYSKRILCSILEGKKQVSWLSKWKKKGEENRRMKWMRLILVR